MAYLTVELYLRYYHHHQLIYDILNLMKFTNESQEHLKKSTVNSLWNFELRKKSQQHIKKGLKQKTITSNYVLEKKTQKNKFNNTFCP